MTDQLHEAVAAGAAWLDERYPGWEQRIDLDLFSMGYCTCCLLGQLQGDYRSARQHWKLTFNDCVALGFSIHATPDGASRPPFSFSDLTTAWSDFIIARLQEPTL